HRRSVRTRPWSSKWNCSASNPAPTRPRPSDRPAGHHGGTRMKSLARFALPIAALVLITACGESQQPPPGDGTPEAPNVAADSALKTDKDRISYMIGMDMARGLDQVKDDIDLDVVERAIEDQLAGREPLLTRDEAVEIRKEFMKQRQEKRAAERKAEAEKNQREGEAFLEKNKARPGVEVT